MILFYISILVKPFGLPLGPIITFQKPPHESQNHFGHILEVFHTLSCIFPILIASFSYLGFVLFQDSWKRSYCWSSAHLATDGDGSVEDAVHPQDGRLRRVDDGRAEHGAEHSAVADGEGSSVHVLHGQLVLTRLQGEGEPAAS